MSRIDTNLSETIVRRRTASPVAGIGGVGGAGSEEPGLSPRLRADRMGAARPRPKRRRGRREAGAAGFGGRLASARDRTYAQERNAAERERVEKMFAGVPVAPDPVVARRSGRVAPGARLRVVPDAGCPVCASTKVATDEVAHGGLLRLSECLHCDHRWTERVRRMSGAAHGAAAGLARTSIRLDGLASDRHAGGDGTEIPLLAGVDASATSEVADASGTANGS